MARLRFPGRPGYRFDRLGVRYGSDEARNVNDPSLAIVAYIHYGLRQFRELFGESDEVMCAKFHLPCKDGGLRRDSSRVCRFSVDVDIIGHCRIDMSVNYERRVPVL